MADTVIPVPFRGTVLTLVDHEGEPFAAMRPIVEDLGIEWSAQHVKLTSDAERWKVETLPVVAADGREREMICLPARKLAAWFETINPRKVHPELAEKIAAYRHECDEALCRYWSADRAEQKPRETAGEPAAAESRPRLEGARFNLSAALAILEARESIPAGSLAARSGMLAAAKRTAESAVFLLVELHTEQEAHHGA